MIHLFQYNLQRRFLFTLILVHLSFLAFSQEKKENEQILDSLTNQYNSVLEDSFKLKIINEILLLSDSGKALEYYQKGYELAKNAPDKQHTLILNIGAHYMRSGQMTLSIPYYEKIISEIDSNQISPNRINALKNLATVETNKGEVEKGHQLLQKAYREALKTRDNQIIYFLLIDISNYHKNIGNLEQALEINQEAGQYIDETFKPVDISTYHNSLGLIHRNLGNYDTAMVYYKKNLDLLKDTEHQYQLAIVYNNMGNIEHSRGRLEKALEYYITSLEIKKPLNNKRSLSFSYLNIGILRKDLGNYKEALEDHKKSMELAKSIDFKNMISFNYQSMGINYKLLKEYDLAILNIEKSIAIATKIKSNRLIIESNNNLGDVYFELENYEKALSYFFIGKNAAEKAGRKANLASALVGIAKCYMEISNSEKADDRTLNSLSQPEIEALLIQGLGTAEEIENTQFSALGLNALIEFYRNNNNYKKGVAIASRLITLNDSIYTQQRADATTEWETKYKTTEQEQEILLLQKDKELQAIKQKTDRNKFIIGFIILLFSAIAGLIYFYLNNQLKRSQEMADVRTKISSDLHDDVGSLLTGLAMQSEILEATVNSESDKARLQKIAGMSRSAMSQMRDAVWAMDARSDNWGSLVDRINEFASETLVEKNIAFKINQEKINPKQELASDIRQSIYLICKEAITNILSMPPLDTILY